MTDKLMSFLHFSSHLNYLCLVFPSQEVREEYDPPPSNSENSGTLKEQFYQSDRILGSKLN